jgi:hypothetical protein
MSKSRTGWTAELLVVFASGCLLATMLWLGLWFFWIRPAEAAASSAKDAALHEKEVALVTCVAAKDQCNQLKNKIQAENKKIDAKLKEALLGWGGCIRSKTHPAEKNAKPSTP